MCVAVGSGDGLACPAAIPVPAPFLRPSLGSPGFPCPLPFVSLEVEHRCPLARKDLLWTGTHILGAKTVFSMGLRGPERRPLPPVKFTELQAWTLCHWMTPATQTCCADFLLPDNEAGILSP